MIVATDIIAAPIPTFNPRIRLFLENVQLIPTNNKKIVQNT